MMKEETHIFQGMKRDVHQIRQDGKFLWDAHNIRITSREDSTGYWSIFYWVLCRALCIR